MSFEEQKFDGLYMSALQGSTNGIDGFFGGLFSFLRRKTDFYTLNEKSFEIVQKHFDNQKQVYKEEEAKKAALKKKQDEEKKKAELEAQKKKSGESQAEVEEISDAEAERIMKEEEERKRRLANGDEEDKNQSMEEKIQKALEEQKNKEGAEGEDDKKDKGQAPNSGNGGSTDKYWWTQTLDELTVYIAVPDKIRGNQLDVKMTNSHFKGGVKGQEPVIDADWFKKIKVVDSMWSVESDGDKRTLQLTITKFEGQCWWESVFVGDAKIDTQKVEPENTQLSQLDGSTRSAVEKMMYDQNQKMQGKPTSEEQGKRDKLKGFMAAHPEMDFSKCKFM